MDITLPSILWRQTVPLLHILQIFYDGSFFSSIFIFFSLRKRAIAYLIDYFNLIGRKFESHGSREKRSAYPNSTYLDRPIEAASFYVAA